MINQECVISRFVNRHLDSESANRGINCFALRSGRSRKQRRHSAIIAGDLRPFRLRRKSRFSTTTDHSDTNQNENNYRKPSRQLHFIIPEKASNLLIKLPQNVVAIPTVLNAACVSLQRTSRNWASARQTSTPQAWAYRFSSVESASPNSLAARPIRCMMDK